MTGVVSKPDRGHLKLHVVDISDNICRAWSSVERWLDVA